VDQKLYLKQWAKVIFQYWFQSDLSTFELWLLPNYCELFNFPWLTYVKLIIGVVNQNLLTSTKCSVNTFFFISLFFQTDAKLISVYHPISEEAPIDASASAGVAFAKGTVLEKEEISTAVDVRMESFFDDADVVVGAMAFAIVATTKEIPVKAPVPSSGPVSTKESTHVVGEAIGESILFLSSFPFP